MKAAGAALQVMTSLPSASSLASTEAEGGGGGSPRLLDTRQDDVLLSLPGVPGSM